MKFKNTYYKLERFTNAFSSRKRIEILNLLKEKPDLTLEEISEKINSNKQNTSLHTFKLLNAGLIAKRKKGTNVQHKLTSRGEVVLNFLISIDKIL